MYSYAEQQRGRLIIGVLTVLVIVVVLFAVPTTNRLLYRYFGPEIQSVERRATWAYGQVLGVAEAIVGAPLRPETLGEGVSGLGGTEYRMTTGGASGGAAGGLREVGNSVGGKLGGATK